MPDQLEDPDKESGSDLVKIHKRWCSELKLADKHEENWRTTVKNIYKKYHAEKEDPDGEMKILWANTEILAAALYSRTPTPDARRRYRDEDEIGKQVANVMTRALEYSIDEYDFDEQILGGIDHALLAGRGVPKIEFIPDIKMEPMRIPVDFEEVPDPAPFQPDRMRGEFRFRENGELLSNEDAANVVVRETDEGFFLPGETESEVEDAVVRCTCWNWDDYRESPARKYGDLRWRAYRHEFSKKELETLFGKDKAKDVKLTITRKSEDADNPDQIESFLKLAEVWEIWYKEEREVIWVSPEGATEAILVEDDPLKLKDFWPSPRPLYRIRPKKDLVPIPEYQMYENQVTELNDINVKINRIVDALRVRGIYDASIETIDSLLESDNNMLTPEKNYTHLAEKGGLDSAISWMPIEMLVNTLKALYEQRDRLIGTIFELTGISDIVRGESDPRETLGAQNIKRQSNALRLGPSQREIQRWIRDIMRIKAEIMVEHFPASVLSRMTGLEVTEEMMEFMRSDQLRSYRIGIETDSTIAADVAQDKTEVTQFLQALTEALGTIGPLVQQGTLPFEAGKAVIMYAIRRFKTSKDLEDAIDALQQPQQTGDQGSSIDEVAAADVQRQAKRDQGEMQLKAMKQTMDNQAKRIDQLLELIGLAIKDDQGGSEQVPDLSGAVVNFQKLLTGGNKGV